MKRERIRNLVVCLCCPRLSLLLKLYEHYKKRFGTNTKSNMNTKLAGRIALASLLVLTCGSIFGFVAFPNLLKGKLKSMVNLKPGNDIRDMYMKLPFPLTFKINPFNVTNPEQVAKGATPILQEVGPYVFEEWREKELLSEDEVSDTIVYLGKETFIFRPDLSNGLTGNEMITIPHPLIVSIALTVVREKPAMLTLVTKALNSIFQKPETPFLTATFNQIFFDGVIINCTVKDFAGKALCTQLKTEAKELQVVAENVFKFSLMGAKNGTAANKFKVMRGVKDYKSTGKVVEWMDKREVSTWSSKECNQFRGTDGTIFPSLLTPKADVLSFAPALCRVIAAKFDSAAKYDGIPCSKYTATFGDPDTIPEDKCYCPSPDECLRKGALDLRKCAGPVVATLPHFYNTDPYYLAGVRGLSPDKEKHELYILFELTSGTPLVARNRLQFNLPFVQIPKLPMMKDVPEVLVPLFWVEESIDLKSDVTKPLKMLFIAKKVVKGLTWVLVIGSLGAFAYSGFAYYTSKREIQITPVKNNQQKKQSSISMVLQGNNEKAGVVNPAMSDNEIHKY